MQLEHAGCVFFLVLFAIGCIAGGVWAMTEGAPAAVLPIMLAIGIVVLFFARWYAKNPN